MLLLVCVRALVERVLQDTTEDLRVQCSRVDQAFSQRCVELTEAKTQLEMKLAQVNRQEVFISHVKYTYHSVKILSKSPVLRST